METNYKKIATEIRKKVLNMKFVSQGSHLGSALSCIDILAVLYFKILKLNVKDSKAPNRDRFLLSKGHAASALYATLAQRGFFPEEMLKTYCQDGSKLAGHVIKDCVPGVEVSTGSLGHGLSIGIGMALMAKKDRKAHRVFVLMSDGECDEGSIWEAAMWSSHHRLDNLIVFIDDNHMQAMGPSRDISGLDSLPEKWEAFGWDTFCVDGHDPDTLIKVTHQAMLGRSKPKVIIARTILGKGISFIEDNLLWHYQIPSANQLQEALAQLETGA